MRLDDEQIAALRDDLTKRLEIKADMLAMGERIAFGSDSAIMRQAAETVHALATEVLESRAAEERWRSNSRETFDAMVAMRNDINEHIPLPSIDSDLARGPGNDVFCAEVAQGVVTALVAKDTEIERLTKERAMNDSICPWCGAYSTRSCELEDEMGVCPWQDQQDAEPNPDLLREDRDERRRLARDDVDGQPS